ncbi:hypothetical protein WUBG_17798 [Wuchereria bancrofti]|uniref:Uncharacterized protein n=1 Tax=Wuchereria bancrofti TaxID=6293 RepID=J9ABE2_WUCBA|nr:hypothetical protein WUBG_17798 [Wuchereria bancrofti]
MPQMNEPRNYPASMAEHGTSKFRSRRSSARFVASRKHSKGQYTSSYSPRNLSSVYECYTSQPILPEYVSTVPSRRNANTTFDSGMPQMNEPRNYPASMAEHGTSKFRSRRSSARFVASRKHSKGQYTSSYSPRNLSSVYEVSLSYFK